MENSVDIKSVKEASLESLKSVLDLIDTIDFTVPETYAAWLSQNYFFVRHSFRLLSLAAAHATLSSDRFSWYTLTNVGAVKSREKLILRDLTELGYGIENFIELPSTKAFYRCQYYLIQNVNPLSIMGYTLFADGLIVEASKEFTPGIIRSFPKAASFVKSFVAGEASRIDKSFKVIESVPKSTYPVILESYHDSAFFYGNILSLLQCCLKSTYVAQAAHSRQSGDRLSF